MAHITVAFSSSAEDSLQRRVHDNNDAAASVAAAWPREEHSFRAFFELDATAAFVCGLSKQPAPLRVALQLPDAYLSAAAQLVRSLRRHPRMPPQTLLVVLADTSYGSCCVDEVAAGHAGADAIVHYGHACLER